MKKQLAMIAVTAIFTVGGGYFRPVIKKNSKICNHR